MASGKDFFKKLEAVSTRLQEWNSTNFGHLQTKGEKKELLLRNLLEGMGVDRMVIPQIQKKMEWNAC